MNQAYAFSGHRDALPADDVHASMAGRRTPASASLRSDAVSFSGFDDPVEIFRAGRHTDSQGNARNWSTADLDQIVANHNAEHPAPIVVGHPKTDAPAYGWTQSLSRVGDKLLARFHQVQPAFAGMVQAGRYRNRSIKVVKGDNGWQLAHVGWLGAAAPAVAGLAPVQFDAAAPGETYTFDADDARNLGLIARGMRNLREFILTKFGQADADTYMPQSQIDALMQAAADEANEPDPDDTPVSSAGVPAPAYSAARAAVSSTASTEHPVTSNVTPNAPPNAADAAKTFTQADLDTERTAREAAEARLAEFTARERISAAQAEIKTHLDAGRLTPAQAQGWAEFLATLDDAAEFEFDTGEGNVKKPLAAFAREFLAKLPVQVEFNRKVAGDGSGVDKGSVDSIHAAAQKHMQAEHAKGNFIPWHEAVSHVMSAAQ